MAKQKITLEVTPAQRSRVASTLKAALQSNWAELEDILEKKDEEAERRHVTALCVAILTLGAKDFVELCRAYPEAAEIEGDESEIIKILDKVVQRYRTTQKWEDLVQGKLTQEFKD